MGRPGITHKPTDSSPVVLLVRAKTTFPTLSFTLLKCACLLSSIRYKLVKIIMASNLFPASDSCALIGTSQTVTETQTQTHSSSGVLRDGEVKEGADLKASSPEFLPINRLSTWLSKRASSDLKRNLHYLPEGHWAWKPSPRKYWG